jgi:hypothetical protein
MVGCNISNKQVFRRHFGCAYVGEIITLRNRKAGP